MKIQHNLIIFLCLIVSVLLIGCASPNHMGMITDPETGLQYGSVIEESFFIDASQFDNKNIKISARNVSGDQNYNIRHFIKSLERSFVEKGYLLSEQNDFGIKYDVVVEYSGHIQSNMLVQYAFLGGAAGGIGGYRSEAKAGTAIGILSGATIGAIVGSYVTNDTYIIVAKVNLGIIDNASKHKKTVRFSSSPKLQEEHDSGVSSFHSVMSSRIAVYAGGRNVKQSEIVYGVKQRLQRILSDII